MCYGIIYKIENKINGKIYIGQTTKTFYERYGGDIRNTHNEHLKRSIEIYGVENFEIDECVCKCDTKEELDRVEQFYIYVYDTMDPNHGYNKKDGGSNGRLSEETKQKMSENHANVSGEKNPMWGKNSEDYMTPEAIIIKREKQSKALKEIRVGEKHPMWGKRPEDYMTPETIQMRRKKISEANSGEKHPMYGKCHSQETKQKMSESLKGEKHPSARAVIQLDKNGNFIKKYDFIKQAARELNIARQNISACCRGRIKSTGGYRWIYETEYLDLLQYAFLT